MALLEFGTDTVVFEGDLADAWCGVFEAALERLKRSKARLVAVDISRARSVSNRAVSLLFDLWLDLVDEDRALFLVASERMWDTFGRVAADRVLAGQVRRASGRKHSGDLISEAR